MLACGGKIPRHVVLDWRSINSYNLRGESNMAYVRILYIVLDKQGLKINF